MLKAILIVISLGLCNSALAIPVEWTLTNVTFEDGSTADGSFIFDADTSRYSDVSITVSLVDGGQAYFDIAYGTADQYVAQFLESGNYIGAMQLLPVSPLTNAAGVVDLSRECGARCDSYVAPFDIGALALSEGSLTGSVVPLPAGLWLFASALAGLAFRCRQSA